MVGVQTIEPGPRLKRAEAWLRDLSKTKPVLRMLVADLGLFAALHQPVQRVLADRLQQGEARPTVGVIVEPQQALVRQRGEHVEELDLAPPLPRGCRVGPRRTDGLNGLQGAPANEHRQASEEALLRLVQQIVAPGDRVAKRALSLRQITGTCCQERQASLEAGQQGARREQLHPRGRQLDGQGQPIQAPADLRHGTCVVIAEPELRAHGGGPLDKQRDRWSGPDQVRHGPGRRVEAAPAMGPGSRARPAPAGPPGSSPGP